MKKNDYLKIAVQRRLYRKANWLVRNLSEFSETPGAEAVTEPYVPFRDLMGLSFFTETGVKEKIDDYSGTGPLFLPSDTVAVDKSWLINIQDSITTRFGILLSNAILITEVFGGKLGYINGEVSIENIEKMIAPRLTNNPNYERPRIPMSYEQMKPINHIDLTAPVYVYEYTRLSKGIELISSVMELFTVALTPKSVNPPDGITEFKQKLIAEYGDRLNDPVVLSEFETRLKQYDAEYLKDDPSFKKFTSGKILNDSRKKLFLSMGAEGGFSRNGEVTAITESLTEGIPFNDPKKAVAIFNSSRSGSFSRGAETVEGGVAAKKMLGAANNYQIVKGDCGSKLGLSRLYGKDLVNSLRGRTLIYGPKQVQVPVDGDTSPYLGQVLVTRSSTYCKLTGERICEVCAGSALARYETGVALPLTEISAAILAARMKAMHTNALTVNEITLEELFT